MKLKLAVISALGLALATACGGGDTETQDGGTKSDAGTTTDAGTKTDAGTTTDAGTKADAGTADAGTADAGTMDAGTTDAGTTDAGTTVDAGPVIDAGVAHACSSFTYPVGRNFTATVNGFPFTVTNGPFDHGPFGNSDEHYYWDFISDDGGVALEVAAFNVATVSTTCPQIVPLPTPTADFSLYVLELQSGTYGDVFNSDVHTASGTLVIDGYRTGAGGGVSFSCTNCSLPAGDAGVPGTTLLLNGTGNESEP